MFDTWFIQAVIVIAIVRHAMLRHASNKLNALRAAKDIGRKL